MQNVRVTFKPARDHVREPAELTIKILDASGHVTSEVALTTADVVDKENREAIRHFADWVDIEARKADYLRRYPLEAGDHNVEGVNREIMEDVGDCFLRDRRDRERFAGLDPAAVRNWRMNK